MSDEFDDSWPVYIATAGGLWMSLSVECVICTHVWVAVCEVETDTEELECPSCGAQDSRPI